MTRHLVMKNGRPVSVKLSHTRVEALQFFCGRIMLPERDRGALLTTSLHGQKVAITEVIPTIPPCFNGFKNACFNRIATALRIPTKELLAPIHLTNERLSA